MKIKHNQQKSAFEPINLTLTIETEDELKALWSRLYINNTLVNGHMINRSEKWSTTDEELFDLYETIDDICDQRGLKK